MLLVDDNPVNLKVAGLMCQQLWPDAALHSVNSGQACLEWLQTQAVDLVLMDLVMPGMDGLETTRAIRQSAAPLCHMAVIGLTARPCGLCASWHGRCVAQALGPRATASQRTSAAVAQGGNAWLIHAIGG